MGKYTQQCFFGEPLTKEVFQSFLSCCHLNLLSAQRIIIFECTKNNHIRSIVAFSTTYSKVCCGQLKCLFQFQTDNATLYLCKIPYLQHLICGTSTPHFHSPNMVHNQNLLSWKSWKITRKHPWWIFFE